MALIGGGWMINKYRNSNYSASTIIKKIKTFKRKKMEQEMQKI